MCRKQEWRDVWGCDGDIKPDPLTGAKMVYAVGPPGQEEELTMCPLSYIKKSRVSMALSLYELYKNGHTPNGSVKQESTLYRSCMEYLSQVEAQINEAHEERMKSKAKKNGNVL